MIQWSPSRSDRVAPTAALVGLLRHALSARPDDAGLRCKLAYAQLELADFEAANASFQEVLRLQPTHQKARRGLARCFNRQGAHQAAIDVLLPEDMADLERAVALLCLHEDSKAECELRALLDRDPNDSHALRHLGKLLRRSGRNGELVRLCETLCRRGARNAQLFYSWGTALALAGDDEKARSLLTDAAHVTAMILPTPAGFADLDSFNRALATEILDNPERRSDFPVDEEANRGSQRVHSFGAGRRPELVRALTATLQLVVEGHVPQRGGGFDPWPEARPQRAHLNGWGLIQRQSQYEDWHLHRGGWLSGVYYAKVPTGIAGHKDGAGCIEFGVPRALARARPELDRRLRIEPHEGLLLLAPSHYAHRTIPMGIDEYRISFAFDVVPERAP